MYKSHYTFCSEAAIELGRIHICLTTTHVSDHLFLTIQEKMQLECHVYN